MSFKTLQDIDVKNKRVIIRADLNVPMKDGVVTDATRITRFAPSVKTLLQKGAAVLILSHFDRPKGKVVPAMSLRPLVAELSKAIGRPVTFVETDWLDEQAQAAASAAKAGDVLLFENTRFAKGEEENDAQLAKKFASLGDVYVNDAFSCAHRAHASTEGIAHLLPSVAGPMMQAELEALTKALEKPERLTLAIVGGAKVSTKLDLIGNLSTKVDKLAIGGAMANTFLTAQGFDVGSKSLVERDMLDTAKKILAEAKCEILLPIDVVVGENFAAHTPHKTQSVNAVSKDGMVLDIGEKSIEQLKTILQNCKTVLWNGPFGAFELEPFDNGTTEVAQFCAELVKQGKLTAVAGGGDTVSALSHAGVVEDFTYVSTAGGAFLEWLEGKALPGVEILKNNALRRTA